jgi:prepilin-type N-terminal cleavage/methylation domain-containing protein
MRAPSAEGGVRSGGSVAGRNCGTVRGYARPTRARNIEDRRKIGFSLIEVMVAVALLSVIIIGLVAMFNQTRRAFTSTMTQVDVLESGRSAADIVGREVEQMAASGGSGVVNFYVQGNFQQIQPLIVSGDFRTNNLQMFYFLTRNNLQWNAVGYKLLQLTNSAQPYTAGLGTLFRYSLNNVALTNYAALTNGFTNVFVGTASASDARAANFSRIVDGVVDFRVRAYDTNGVLFTNMNRFTVFATNYPPLSPGFPTNDYQYLFSSNSLPAYVEIELGVLEDRSLAKYQAILNPGGLTPAPNSLLQAATYLNQHAGDVHIFRQRIAIRGVNPTAYQ